MELCVFSFGVAVVGVISAAAVTRAFRLRPLLLLLGVLIGDAFGADVLASIAIGELEVATGVPVFIAMTIAGLQPAVALLGPGWSPGAHPLVLAGNPSGGSP